MSEKQRALLLHALGLDRSKHAYRNRYAAERGTDAEAEWRSMVEAGWAREVSCDPTVFPDAIFAVTRAGLRAIGRDDLADAEGRR